MGVAMSVADRPQSRQRAHAIRNGPMTTAQTAEEAFARYQTYMAEGRLLQSSWHSQADDGRQLACGLGVLGDDVNSPSDCPAQIMPRWLAQMVPWFFDNQSADDAFAWGLDFYAELKRLNGVVPFSVVYDWQATIVGPYAVETAEKRGYPSAPAKALAELQWKALTGEKFTADDWRPILKAAFYEAYKYRYRALADADALADALADANANADAYADADADAYADAYTYADAYAYRAGIKRLAAGMVECLKRVPSPE